MKYVKIFLDNIDSLELLSDEERGRLFLAILLYAKNGELSDLPGNERFLWDMFKRQMDRASDKYQEKLAASPRRVKKSVPAPSPSYDIEEIKRFISSDPFPDVATSP